MSILFIFFSILTRNKSSFVIHHFINLLFSGIELYNGDVTLPIWELRALIDWGVIRTDLVGGLARSGIKSFYFDIEKENHAINTSEDDATQVAKRYTYKHNSYLDFHKIVISLLENGSCSPFNLFYVQYYFEGGEKDI